MVLARRLQSIEVLAAKPSRALHECEGLRLQAEAKILELQGEQKNKESTHINTARREWNPWNLVEVTTQHFTKSSEGSSLWRQRTGSKGSMQIQSQNQGTSRRSHQARRTTSAAKAKATTSSLASRSNENLDSGNSSPFQSSVRQPSPLEPTSMRS